jgi:peptide/nickel transport system substrate-binding protein
MRSSFKMLSISLMAVTSFCTFAKAGAVLGLDESPVGEPDPAKASDYAQSVLMFNVYDTRG